MTTPNTNSETPMTDDLAKTLLTIAGTINADNASDVVAKILTDVFSHTSTLERELSQLKQANAELEARCYQLEFGKYNARYYAMQCMELAASEAKLREALEKMGGYAIVLNAGGAWPRLRDEDTFKEALSTPPSDALKPWVELCKTVGEIQIFEISNNSLKISTAKDQARELLKSIGQ